MVVLMAIATPDFTGASRMAWVIARQIKLAGHEVIVVTGPKPPAGQTSVIDVLQADGIKTIQVDGFEERTPSRKLINRICEISRDHNVTCLISETQQDIKVMPYVAKKSGINLIYHAQNMVQFSGNYVIRMIKRALYRRLLSRYVYKTICVAESLRLQHLNEFRIPSSRVMTIDNGVHLDKFAPIPASERDRLRNELGIADNELMFLNVGRLSFQKGQDLLLRSLIGAKLQGKPYKLVIVGAVTLGQPEDAAYEAELLRLAASPELKDRIIFAGWRDDVPKLLLSADGYLHSANWEGMPLAVLEAMAAGLPSVSTDCSGLLTDFVPGVHGYVVKTGDESAFRAATEHLVGLSDEQRAEMGRQAKALTLKNFDVNVTTRRFTEIVEQAGATASTIRPRHKLATVAASEDSR